MNFMEFRKINPETINKLANYRPALSNINLSWMTDHTQKMFKSVKFPCAGVECMPEKRSYTLIVKVTHLCNLNCPYCYDRILRDTAEVSKMSEATVLKIAELFKDQQVQWIWHGGEPTMMGKDFYRKMNPLLKKLIPDIIISMQTNGKVLDQEWFDLFTGDNLTQPGLSFDGLTNEDTRGTTKEFLDIVDFRKKDEKTVGSILVITEKNIDNLIEEYEYAKKIGYDPQMNLAFDPGYETEHELNQTDRAITAFKKFFEYWVHDVNGVRNSALERWIRQVSGELGTLCEHQRCVGRWFGIDCNGDIYPCGRNWINFVPYTNVHDISSIEEIKQTARFNEWRNTSEKFFEREDCKNCNWRPVCDGGCPAVAHMSAESTDAHCKIRRAMLDYIFGRLQEINIYSHPEKYNPAFISVVDNSILSTQALLDLTEDLP